MKLKDYISNHDLSSMKDLEFHSMTSGSKVDSFKYAIGKRSKVASNSESGSVKSRPSLFKAPLCVGS